MRSLMFVVAISTALGASLAQNASRLDYQAPDFGKNLNSLCNKQTAAAGDIQDFMQFVHKVFSVEHLQWGGINFQFSTDKQAYRYYNPEYLKALRGLLFKDPKQVKAIFEQAIPAFQQQFGKMTDNERADYLQFLRSGLAYAQNFDLAREKRDLHEIETVQRGSFRDTKGQLQAFIYRRIAANDISKQDCIQYLERTIQKLDSTAPADPKNPLRNYVIAPIYAYSEGAITLYQGQIYKHSGNYQPKPLFYLLNNQFFPLPKQAKFASGHKIGQDVLILAQNETYSYDLYLCPLAKNNPSPNIPPNPLALSFAKMPQINEITPQLLAVSIDSRPYIYISTNKNTPAEVHIIAPAQQNPFGIYIVNSKDGTPRLLSQSRKLQTLVPNAHTIAISPDSARYWIMQGPTLVCASSAKAYNTDTLNLGYRPDSIRAVGMILRVWQQGKMETIRHQGTRLEKLPTPKGVNLANLGIKIDQLQTFQTEDGGWGAYDPQYNLVIPPLYKALQPDISNLHIIAQNAQGKYGILSHNNDTLIDFLYTALDPIQFENEQVYIVSKNAPAHDLPALAKYPDNPNFGIIDIEGVERLPLKYYYIYYLTPALSLVGQKSKNTLRYAILNSENYKFTSKFDYLPTSRADTFYTIDPNTFAEIQVSIEQPLMPNVLISNFDGSTEDALNAYGGFLLRSAQGWHLIDYYGKKVNTPQADSLAFSPARAHFQFYKADKYGLIDAEGSIIVPALYQHIYNVPDTDLFFASPTPEDPNAKYTLYNRSGKTLHKEPFHGIQQQFLLFDPETFEERIELKFCPPATGVDFGVRPQVYILYRDSLAGLYDAEGQIIIPNAYQNIQILNDGTNLKALAVQKSDKFALFSPQGKALTDFIYTRIEFSGPSKVTAFLPDGAAVDLSNKIAN